MVTTLSHAGGTPQAGGDNGVRQESNSQHHLGKTNTFALGYNVCLSRVGLTSFPTLVVLSFVTAGILLRRKTRRDAKMGDIL